MNLKEQVETDIFRALENLETQNKNDQLETLRNLVDKYVHLSTAEHVLNDHDLREIIGSAKQMFASKTMPTFIGPRKRKTAPDEEANLCVIEATIGALNKRDCLKKLPKFDYKEDKL